MVRVEGDEMGIRNERRRVGARQSYTGRLVCAISTAVSLRRQVVGFARGDDGPCIQQRCTQTELAMCGSRCNMQYRIIIMDAWRREVVRGSLRGHTT